MPGAGARVRAVSLAALSSMCLGACAQVTVISDNGPPKTEWKFGVLAIDVAGSEKNTIIATKGVGLITTPDGPTLGYADAKFVRIGDECRLVIQTSDANVIASHAELLRVLKTIPKACAA
jgi:hypothetical protein